jgi:hypothetical protein
VIVSMTPTGISKLPLVSTEPQQCAQALLAPGGGLRLPQPAERGPGSFSTQHQQVGSAPAQTMQSGLFVRSLTAAIPV